MHLYEMNWPRVKELTPDTPVVVPIAALEQHGPHMPVFTDSLLLGEVVRRTEEQLRDRVLFTPLMWLGNSEHHIDFAGTLTASPRTYITMLKEIAGNLLTHGFRRILLLNGHGGNIVPSQQALFELRQEHRDRDDLQLFSATYWEAGPPPSDSTLVQSRMGHACEWETSMILHLHPHLVGEIKQLEPITQEMPFAPAHLAWITQDRSTPGYIGDPAAATAAKGERLLDHFTANVVALLEKVFDRAR
ncbi:MAG: creatininase family protein [Planctomycetaceae bacterium]|nr:creatininase family protein [Planctomycetaceae bacterium]